MFGKSKKGIEDPSKQVWNFFAGSSKQSRLHAVTPGDILSYIFLLQPKLIKYFQKKTESNERLCLTLEENLYKNLKNSFNYTEFKSTIQKHACLEIAKRKQDVYVSMPTGAG